MKTATMTRTKITHLAVACLLILSPAAKAGQGNDAGGGGKEEEIEFAELAQVFRTNLQKSRATESHFQDLDDAAFDRAIAGTQIFAKENLCFELPDQPAGGGSIRCLDAQYLPELHRIEMSLDAWAGKTCVERLSLVVHEFGRAAGIENGNYKYSARVRLSTVMVNACTAFGGGAPEELPKNGDIKDEEGAWLLSWGTLLVPRTDLILPAKTKSFSICGSTFSYSEDSVPTLAGCDQVPIPDADLAVCRFNFDAISPVSKVWNKGKGHPMVAIEKQDINPAYARLSFNVSIRQGGYPRPLHGECYLSKGKETRVMNFGQLKLILGHYFEIQQPAPTPMLH